MDSRRLLLEERAQIREGGAEAEANWLRSLTPYDRAWLARHDAEAESLNDLPTFWNAQPPKAELQPLRLVREVKVFNPVCALKWRECPQCHVEYYRPPSYQGITAWCRSECAAAAMKVLWSALGDAFRPLFDGLTKAAEQFAEWATSLQDAQPGTPLKPSFRQGLRRPWYETGQPRTRRRRAS